MTDLRAEYKKMFAAAKAQESEFQCSECSGCGIESLRNHRTLRGYCKYFTFSAVVYTRFTVSIKNAGCMLLDDAENKGK